MLDQLLRSEASVNELVDLLGVSQPTVSKHLKVLRENRLVVTRVEAQRRIYSLTSQPLAEIDSWLAQYRQTWNQHVDALAGHLDQKYPHQKKESS
jgi:DNA-binding transcriptional ArsR family regulator